jgi:signal transduction histidine kinase
MAQALHDDLGQSVAAIYKTLGIARTMFYRYTKEKKTKA